MGRIVRIIFYTIVVVLTLITVIWLSTDVMSGTSFGLNFARVLTIVAALGVVVSSVLYMAHSPKNAVKPLVMTALILLIAVISYLVSPGEMLEEYIKFGISTETESRMVDVGLYLALALGGGAIILTLVSEVISLVKN